MTKPFLIWKLEKKIGKVKSWLFSGNKLAAISVALFLIGSLYIVVTYIPTYNSESSNSTPLNDLNVTNNSNITKNDNSTNVSNSSVIPIIPQNNLTNTSQLNKTIEVKEPTNNSSVIMIETTNNSANGLGLNDNVTSDEMMIRIGSIMCNMISMLIIIMVICLMLRMLTMFGRL